MINAKKEDKNLMGHFERLLRPGFLSNIEKNFIFIKDLSVHFVY